MQTKISHLVCTLVLACCPIISWAASEVYSSWDGTATAVTPVGHVYSIQSAQDLAWAAEQTRTGNSFLGDTLLLTANIDLAGRLWTPLGNATTPFAGVLLGENHLVRGLSKMRGDQQIGLLGHIASTGKVKDLGVSGGEILASGKNYVGTLAGVNEGEIERCWSMAEIAIAGKVVGGLVGVNRGSLTDVYATSLILGAQDSVGALVGRNEGAITRAYAAGYAKNGYGFVAADAGGTYADCYYDRKLYYQEPGFLSEDIHPADHSEEIFLVFQGNEVWYHQTGTYPCLAGFAATDAALLSVAPAYVDTASIDPVNHLNDLTVDFTVHTAGGITWQTRNDQEAEWIAISGANVTVTRPCAETDMLVDATLGSEKHVVYMRPRPIENLLYGSFLGDTIGFCRSSYVALTDPITTVTQVLPSQGWTEGNYHYMVLRYGYDAQNEPFVLDTLVLAHNTADYLSWQSSYTLDTDTSGWFALKRYVHDEGCIRDWVESEGEWVYCVFFEFDPGKITNGLDTLYGVPQTVGVQSLTPAMGGQESDIYYVWYMNGTAIPNATTENLTGYNITTKGTYVFTRTASDDFCYQPQSDASSNGVYTYVVFDSLNPGEINVQDPLSFCTLEEAQAYTVTATLPTGGNGEYLYQWYLVDTVAHDTAAIAGATGQHLTLSLLTMEAGHSYVVVRKVEDNTRFTTLTLSRYAQRIEVVATLTAGVIADGEQPSICWAWSDQNIKAVTILSEDPAHSTSQYLEYRWLRILGTDTVVVGDAAMLSYSLNPNDITMGATYTYIRYARNSPDCYWMQADGVAQQTYYRGTSTDTTLSVCSTDMPYMYVAYDGSTHLFTYHGERFLVHALTPEGCQADTVFTLQVSTVPDITVDGNARLCQNEGDIIVYLNLNNATAISSYHISFSPNMAKFVGRTDTTGLLEHTVDDTYIVRLNNIPVIGSGDNYFMLDVLADDGECSSRAHRVDLDLSLGGYLHQKFDRVLFIDNNPLNGEVAGDKLTFTSYRWYRNGVEQPGQTGQYYQENGAILEGTYYAIVIDDDGVAYRTCDIVMPQEQGMSAPEHVLSVYPVPVAPGAPMTIFAPSGEATMVSFTGETVCNLTTAEGETVISAPSVSGIYFVRVVTTDHRVATQKVIVK